MRAACTLRRTEPLGAPGLAADFLHLTDRGYLRARAFADVAVFGSDT
jgi:hypothetical protein